MNLLTGLSENALRQAIDSFTVFGECRRVEAQASEYVGGMYWKVQGPYEYLVRTFPDNRQERLGARSPETERLYESFRSAKAQMGARLRSLRLAVWESERLNKALRLGHAPVSVVAFLSRLEAADFFEYCAVIGTHALYAYEAKAGVRISRDAFDAGRERAASNVHERIQLLISSTRPYHSIIQLLRDIDKSFRRKNGQSHVAINDAGFEVECFQSDEAHVVPHLSRPSRTRGEVRPAILHHADPLATDEELEQIVVASSGRMATMRTVSPKAFVEFATMAANAASKERIQKGERDLVQIAAVQRLLDENWL